MQTAALLIVAVICLTWLAIYVYEKVMKYTAPPEPVSTEKQFLGIMQKWRDTDNVTTVIPVPFSASTCSHSWEPVVDKVLEMPHEKKLVAILQCVHCGMIDKTCQTTSNFKPEIQPCHHDWLTESSQTIEAPHEQKFILVMKCKKCGALDKTTETTSKPPPVPVLPTPKSECRHKWDVEKRVTLDSAYEQMLESLKTKANNYNSTKKIDPNKELDLNLDEAPKWMFAKTYICVRTCTACGEIKETIASNFEEKKEEEE